MFAFMLVKAPLFTLVLQVSRSLITRPMVILLGLATVARPTIPPALISSLQQWSNRLSRSGAKSKLVLVFPLVKTLVKATSFVFPGVLVLV